MPSEPVQHRLHPASLVFSLFSIVRRFFLPGLAVLYFGRGGIGLDWGVAFFAGPAVVYALVRYISLRYVVSEDELIIRQGILRRDERHIPFARIHTIDTSRTLLHRWLGVTDVKIQTASGKEPEAVLQVLSLTTAEQLRRRVVTRRHEVQDGVQEADGDQSAIETTGKNVVAQATIRDLLALGLISNRGMLVVGAVLGVLWQLDVEPPTDRLQEMVAGIPGLAESWGLLHTAVLVVLGVGAVIVAVRMLSMLWSVVTLFDFTVSIQDERVRVRYGLLTQRSLTIPRHRLQLVRTEAGLLHRLFRRVSISARTAGATGGEHEGKSQDWLMPVLHRDAVLPFLANVHPDLRLGEVVWHRAHPRAVARMRVRLLVLLLLPVLASALLHPLVLLGSMVGAAVLVMVVPPLEYRHLAYAVTPHAVWVRRGWLRRRLVVVRISKIQALGVSTSPFDRRREMATLHLDAANAGFGAWAISLPYLGEELARDLYARLAAAVARTEFRW